MVTKQLYYPDFRSCCFLFTDDLIPRNFMKPSIEFDGHFTPYGYLLSPT